MIVYVVVWCFEKSKHFFKTYFWKNATYKELRGHKLKKNEIPMIIAV